MKMKIIAATVCMAFVMTGCENPKQTMGTIGGGALGAWAGSTIGKGKGNVVATAVGGVLGALAGSYIGGELDKADKERAERTAYQSLETSKTGQVSQWHNPDSGNSGSIVPTRTYQAQDGRYCREFTQKIKVGGREQEAYGKACRQPDGTWQIVQ